MRRSDGRTATRRSSLPGRWIREAESVFVAVRPCFTIMIVNAQIKNAVELTGEKSVGTARSPVVGRWRPGQFTCRRWVGDSLDVGFRLPDRAAFVMYSTGECLRAE